jgi:hypothetical protein
MKKLIIIACISIVFIIGGYFSFQYFYPRIVADAIVSNRYSEIIPKRYRDQFTLVGDTINQRVTRLLEITEDKGITINDLLMAIDEIEEQDVRNMIAELYVTKIDSIEQVYEIGTRHIKITIFDPELLKEPFLRHVEVHHVRKGLKYIKKHDLENQLSAKSGRKIAKQIIIQKKDKIMKKAKVVQE